MRDFEKQLRPYRIGEVVSVENEGVLGAPVTVSVYYDMKHGMPKAGFRSTNLIVYVVGVQCERFGTKSDEEITKSMLERGYIVAVIDYLDNPLAVMPKVDFSLQKMRARIVNGEFFGGAFPAGQYKNSFVVPSGYDVSLAHVYYEMDKYCVDGTIEKVVETWNNDFRGTKGARLVKWTDSEGKRKKVAPAFDGTEPVWLDCDGNPDENGEYTNVKYTVARNILDCVQSDGTPIDFKLYIHFIYPTAPKAPVPIMCLASSSEHLASGASMMDRPQAIGATLRGYASVMFDYGYVPMARHDHYGYFDGYPMKGAVTGDNKTYSLHHYNEKLIDTAAMRYIRYAALTNEAFVFDTDHIGVYGNSKGGCFPHLGEAHVEKMKGSKFFAGHHGETRLEGTTPGAYGFIGAAAEQPWQSYEGKKLRSDIQFVYASCGGGFGSITDGHAPTFVSCNLGCPSCYRSSVEFVNVCRAHDVPTLWFEVDQGHTLASADDVYHGVNTYAAFFDFADTILKGEAPKVVYADMERGAMHVKFTGSVCAEAAEKITWKGKAGDVPCTKAALYGNTEWILTPAKAVEAGEYTLTVSTEVGVECEYEKTITIAQSITPSVEKKMTGEVVHRELPFDSFVSPSNARMMEAFAPDGTPALAIVEPYVNTQYGVERFYQGYLLIDNPTVIKEGKLTKEDIGRRFRISFKIWDCDVHYVNVSLSGCTNGEQRFNDYRRPIFNVVTKQGEWTTVSFDYTVYAPEHGEIGEIVQRLLVSANLYGTAHKPIYFKDFMVEEFV